MSYIFWNAALKLRRIKLSGAQKILSRNTSRFIKNHPVLTCIGISSVAIYYINNRNKIELGPSNHYLDTTASFGLLSSPEPLNQQQQQQLLLKTATTNNNTNNYIYNKNTKNNIVNTQTFPIVNKRPYPIPPVEILDPTDPSFTDAQSQLYIYQSLPKEDELLLSLENEGELYLGQYLQQHPYLTKNQYTQFHEAQKNIYTHINNNTGADTAKSLSQHNALKDIEMLYQRYLQLIQRQYDFDKELKCINKQSPYNLDYNYFWMRAQRGFHTTSGIIRNYLSPNSGKNGAAQFDDESWIKDYFGSEPSKVHWLAGPPMGFEEFKTNWLLQSNIKQTLLLSDNTLLHDDNDWTALLSSSYNNNNNINYPKLFSQISSLPQPSQNQSSLNQPQPKSSLPSSQLQQQLQQQGKTLEQTLKKQYPNAPDYFVTDGKEQNSSKTTFL